MLRGETWRVVGRRGGLGGVADRLHGWLARDGAPGLGGERKAVLEGIVLGEDQGLSDTLKQRFRASGLYHLLAVSGSNVAVVAGGALGLLFLLGVSRRWAEAGAIAAIGGYVLAVGPQPSVIRAGIVGVLGSLAWLFGRQRDAWHALLLAAAGLLAWNPYLVLDAGFQLSFAAVLSIFLVAPRIRRVLDGYPLPNWLPDGRRGLGRLRSRHRARCPGSSSTRSRCSPCPRTRPPHPRSRRCSGSRSSRRRSSPVARPVAVAAHLGERLVRRVSRRLRTVLRRTSGSPDPLAAGGRRSRRGRPRVGRLCLASWPTS